MLVINKEHFGVEVERQMKFLKHTLLALLYKSVFTTKSGYNC